MVFLKPIKALDNKLHLHVECHILLKCLSDVIAANLTLTVILDLRLTAERI